MFNRRQAIQASAIGLSSLFVPKVLGTELSTSRDDSDFISTGYPKSDFISTGYPKSDFISTGYPKSDFISTGYPKLDEDLGGGLKKGTFVIIEQFNDEFSRRIRENNLNDICENDFIFTKNKLQDLCSLRRLCFSAHEENKILIGVSNSIKVSKTSHVYGYSDARVFSASTVLSIYRGRIGEHGYYVRILKNRYGEMIDKSKFYWIED